MTVSDYTFFLARRTIRKEENTSRQCSFCFGCDLLMIFLIVNTRERGRWEITGKKINIKKSQDFFSFSLNSRRNIVNYKKKSCIHLRIRYAILNTVTVKIIFSSYLLRRQVPWNISVISTSLAILKSIFLSTYYF